MLQNIFDKENVVDVDVSQMRLDTHTQCGVKGLSLTLKSKSVVEVMKNLRVENSSAVYSKTFTKLEDVLSINQPEQQKMFTCNTNRIAKLIPLDDQGQRQYSITFNKDAIHLLSSNDCLPQLNLSWLTSEPIDDETIGVFWPPNVPVEAGRWDLFQEKTIELLNLVVGNYLLDIHYCATGTIRVVKHQEFVANHSLFPTIKGA